MRNAECSGYHHQDRRIFHCWSRRITIKCIRLFWFAHRILYYFIVRNTHINSENFLWKTRAHLNPHPPTNLPRNTYWYCFQCLLGMVSTWLADRWPPVVLLRNGNMKSRICAVHISVDHIRTYVGIVYIRVKIAHMLLLCVPCQSTLMDSYVDLYTPLKIGLYWNCISALPKILFASVKSPERFLLDVCIERIR